MQCASHQITVLSLHLCLPLVLMLTHFTLNAVHAALDLREELDQREGTEVAALAELGAGVSALCESIDALERRVRALYPEWPGFTQPAISTWNSGNLAAGEELEGRVDGQLKREPEPGSGY